MRQNLRPRYNTRQPVWPPVPIGPRDMQQDPPCAWCIYCGREVYHPERVICKNCEKELNDEELLC